MKTIPQQSLAIAAFCLFSIGAPASAIVDANGNQQSDVWEMLTGASSLAAGQDADGDGFSNASESVAGTDARNARSFPAQSLDLGQGNTATVRWPSLIGKSYRVEVSSTLGATENAWQTLSTQAGTGAALGMDYPIPTTGNIFFRVRVFDVDTDADGVSDLIPGRRQPTATRGSRRLRPRPARAIPRITSASNPVWQRAMLSRWSAWIPRSMSGGRMPAFWLSGEQGAWARLRCR
jgi:hypothetical protein